MIVKFNVKDKVKFTELKVAQGRIISILITVRGIEYEVRYFNGIEPLTGWFFEDELKQFDAEILELNIGVR